MQHDSPIELLSMVTHAPSGQRCYVAARSWPANGHGSLYDLMGVPSRKLINAVTAGEISDIAPPDLAACGITKVVT